VGFSVGAVSPPAAVAGAADLCDFSVFSVGAAEVFVSSATLHLHANLAVQMRAISNFQLKI
jgi:hypothetical protein